MPEQQCSNPQPHGEHEWLEGFALRRECPGVMRQPREPANRAERRGNVTHPLRAQRRIRRGGRNGR